MEKLGEYFIKFKENKFFKILNYLITFISIFFVIITLFEFDLSKIFLINTNNLIIYILIVSCSSFIQSKAWGKLFNNKNSKFYSIIWINSNIGKYVPLKVGVVINRYAKLKNESVKSVTKNYFLEQFLIILSSILFSLPLYFYKNIYAIVISILFITALLLKFLLINKVSLLLYSLSTIMNLLFLSLLSKDIFDNVNYELVSFYIISTILGMIIFTSPAGLGVRESIFIFLLQGSIDSIYLLNFIVISRLIYFISDIFILIMGNLILKNEKKSNN